MEVKIRYCGTCGYRKRAEQLAERVRDALRVPTLLERGRLGEFTVHVDGDPIASKGLLAGLIGRGWPEADRVIAAIARRLRASQARGAS